MNARDMQDHIDREKVREMQWIKNAVLLGVLVLAVAIGLYVGGQVGVSAGVGVGLAVAAAFGLGLMWAAADIVADDRRRPPG